MSMPDANATANPGKLLIGIGLLLSVLLIGFFMTRGTQSSSMKTTGNLISADTLADQYGVRVNLIAVTAAGGLVDFRLKILDAEKARLLLQDSNDIPSLLVGNGGALLTAPEDATGQLLNNLVDDGNVFLAFPNVGSVVKPGTLVTVQFDEIGLEPVTVK